jgi:hypothetical protein
MEDNVFIKAKPTAHNRIVCAPPPLAAPGFHSPRSLRSHGSLHPQFVGPGNAAHFPIRAAKPSHTTGTLCDMGQINIIC